MPNPKMRNGVIKRGNSYAYVISISDPATGAKRQTWISKDSSGRSFANRKEAELARSQAIAAQHAGTFVLPSSATLAEYLPEWLASRRAGIKAKTYEGYSNAIQFYLVPVLGNVQLQKLTPSVISRAYGELIESGGRSGQGLSVSTVKIAHRVLRAALFSAVDDGLLAKNPCQKAILPKGADRKAKALTADQLNSLLKLAAGHRMYAAFYLAAFTGMRSGEVVALRWSDVDFEKLIITVSRSVDIVQRQDRSYERVTDTPKGGRSRVVPITKSVAEVLTAHKARQSAEATHATDLWQNGLETFLDPFGGPIRPDLFRSMFDGFRKTLGWDVLPAGERPTFHWLRHTHATLLLLNGVPVHVVADRLGHSSPTVTWDTYAHLLPGHDTAAAEVFELAFSSSLAESLANGQKVRGPAILLEDQLALSPA